ncbi:uncharacterized protein PS065_012022 [Dugong dugon]
MVPAAPDFPSNLETREAPSQEGVSPPGAGTQLRDWRQVSGSSCGRRGSYTISSHKAEGGGGEADARSKSPGGRRLPPPPPPLPPPPGASSVALGRVPAGAARPAAAPQARALRRLAQPAPAAPAAPAAEAVCNRQLRQPREDSRDRREEPGRRRGARRRNTQAPPSSPPFPGTRGWCGGGGGRVPPPPQLPGPSGLRRAGGAAAGSGMSNLQPQTNSLIEAVTWSYGTGPGWPQNCTPAYSHSRRPAPSPRCAQPSRVGLHVSVSCVRPGVR